MTTEPLSRRSDRARHGQPPFVIPEAGEEWELYSAMSGPLEPCGPDCIIDCVCDADDELEEAA